MRRTLSLALVVGSAALGSLWFAAPAAPATPQATATAHRVTRATPAPVLPQLKDPQAPAPEYPAPSRDPFNYGNRPQAPRGSGAKPAMPAPVAAPPPPLPVLVAIVSKATDGGVLHSAVFSAGNGVSFLNAGDAIGAFVINDITTDSVVLMDRTSGAAFGLSLK